MLLLFVTNIHVFKCFEANLRFQKIGVVIWCGGFDVLRIISFMQFKEPKRFVLSILPFMLCIFL
jgi:hypothetical protein